MNHLHIDMARRIAGAPRRWRRAARQGMSPTPAAVRRRLTGVLFAGAALGATAHLAAGTVATLAAHEITGSAALAGVPAAAGVLGTAVGTSLLTRRVERVGRRSGLLTGYAAAIAGGLLCIAAVAAGTLPFLVVGMALLGLGNASNHLARYTAADMHPTHRRGAVLGIVVWAGTIGSVVGPTLIAPSGRIAVAAGRSDLTGGFLVAVVFVALALLLYLAALRPDPGTLAIDEPRRTPVPVGRVEPGAARTFAVPGVREAATAMVAAQVVMVMIMTSTPLHIRHHGLDLGVVGLVITAHTSGMFALSPLTGRLVDRFGGLAVALAGLALLAASALVTAGSEGNTPVLVATLFTLGLGWNLAFVAGSSLLAVGGERAVRARVQGRVDSVTWGAGAVAGITSGVLYQASGFRSVSLVGLALLAVPVAVLLRMGRTPPHLATAAEATPRAVAVLAGAGASNIPYRPQASPSTAAVRTGSSVLRMSSPEAPK